MLNYSSAQHKGQDDVKPEHTASYDRPIRAGDQPYNP